MTSDATGLCITPPAPRREQPFAQGDGSSLRLQLWRPSSTAVVVHVAGGLDSHTVPRLRALVAPRLSSMVETVVLDFSQLEFLGVAGLELLAQVRWRGASRAMTVRVVAGPVCVDRALRAAGWTETVPTYPSLAAAVAGLSGRARAGTPVTV